MVALLLPRQTQQVCPGWVGLAGLRRGQVEREFGPEPDPDGELAGGVVEPDSAVHAVVIGENERVELEPGGLLDERLGVGGAVEFTDLRKTKCEPEQQIHVVNMRVTPRR